MSALHPESPDWPVRKVQAYLFFARIAAGLLRGANGMYPPHYYPGESDTYLGIRISRAVLGDRGAYDLFSRTMSITHHRIITLEFEEMSGKHINDFVSLETYVEPKPSYPEALHLHADGAIRPYRSAFDSEPAAGYAADPEHGLARALGIVANLLYNGDEMLLIAELERSTR